MPMNQSVIWYKNLGIADVELVGGKNASLGEMITHLNNKGVRVPNGFATTADAYRQFLQQNELGEQAGFQEKPEEHAVDTHKNKPR